MNMIEKVARAIQGLEGCYEGCNHCKRIAIKCIAAMREPSGEMVIACLHLYFKDEKDGNNTKDKFNGRNLWMHMIDAALKE